MCVVHQIINAVNFYNVDVIVVAPSAGPCFGNEERVASIFKSRPALHYYWMSDVESVFPSEIGLELIVRNSPMLLRGLFVLVLLHLSCRSGRLLFFGPWLLFRRLCLSFRGTRTIVWRLRWFCLLLGLVFGLSFFRLSRMILVVLVLGVRGRRNA